MYAHLQTQTHGQDSAKQSSMEVKKLQGECDGLRKLVMEHEKEIDKLKGEIKARTRMHIPLKADSKTYGAR